jgi:ElaA protein
MEQTPLMTSMQLTWILKEFSALSPAELYAIIRLRNEVFVIEQNCIYQDADNKDQLSLHLCGWAGDELVAYTRLLPPGVSYAESAIGRVVTAPKHRKAGLGRELMQVSIEKAFQTFNTDTIKIGAQVYLKKFYQSLGFEQCSDDYLEDGIPHIMMLLHK